MRTAVRVALLVGFTLSADPGISVIKARLETLHSELDTNISAIIDEHLSGEANPTRRSAGPPPSVNPQRTGRILLANPSPKRLHWLARYSLVEVLEVYAAARQLLRVSHIQLVDVAIQSLELGLQVVENDSVLSALPSAEEVDRRLETIDFKIKYHTMQSGGSGSPHLISVEHEAFGGQIGNLMHVIVLDTVLTPGDFMRAYKTSADFIQNQILPELSGEIDPDMVLVLEQARYALEARFDTYTQCAKHGNKATCIAQIQRRLAVMQELRNTLISEL